MPGKESSVFGDDGGGDTWMQRPAGEVDVTTYTPLPENEQLPDMSELEREVPDQSAGMTPLDEMILDERLQVEGFSAYSEGGSGARRVWVRRANQDEEESEE